MENQPQSYGASPAIWDHTALPATFTRPVLTPGRQAGTRLTYPGKMEGWVDLAVGYILRRFSCTQTVTYPCSNRLIATRPIWSPTPYKPHKSEFTGMFSMFANSAWPSLRAWAGAISIGESWNVNRKIARCTRPVSVVSQCKPSSGWELTKRISVPPYRPCGSGRTLRFYSITSITITTNLCQFVTCLV